ncbi:glycosyltransferase family A protein [Sphingobacterium sp. SG20118]|uniref:glycosyltransferase family A protein n=1 Tax=Sphingobacterium sp. SG20118 TaxID=3367156 RepID=UPI0037DFC13A
MKLKISVIVSTYGRCEELDILLDSLSKQDCDIDFFEVIVVDQNDMINLSPLIASYQNKLNLVHFKSTVKGLSKAKNKGIELAKAQILTFPDDDCTFYPNTISSALDFLNKNPSVDVLYGRIFDRSANKNIMLNWSTKEVRLNLFNYTFNYSAISCFTRLKMKFDENFGVGAEIGLGEET